MKIDHLRHSLENRNLKTGLIYTVNPGSSDDFIDDIEIKIGIIFPEKVRDFYKKYNGIEVEEPYLNILPIDMLILENRRYIHFATAGKIKIGFDTERINSADQWDIINLENRRLITYTVGSFLVNKIWKWIDHKSDISNWYAL